MKTTDDILKFLDKSTCSESLVVIGLGNPDRADDGIGIELVSRLRAHFPEQVFLETEQSVESLVSRFLDKEEIDTIVFVDASDFGGVPGEVKFFKAEDTERFVPAISTHKVPITILMRLIQEKGKIPILLGVQPVSVEFFRKMSSPVKSTLCMIERAFILFLTRGKK